ncbi:hypothetical protein GCM10008941_37250 [Rhizomicrobium palustre]
MTNQRKLNLAGAVHEEFSTEVVLAIDSDLELVASAKTVMFVNNRRRSAESIWSRLCLSRRLSHGRTRTRQILTESNI